MNKVRCAYEILNDILRNKSYSNISLNKKLPFSDDRAFTTRIVLGVLEKYFELEYIIKSLTEKKSPKPVIKIILYIGIYLLKYCDRLNDKNAINMTLKLAEEIGKSSNKGFINAILVKSKSVKLPEENDFINYLSVKYSYPEWLINLYLKHFGKDFTEKLITYKKEDDLIHFRLHSISTEDLKNNNIEFTVSPLNDACYMTIENAKKADNLFPDKIVAQSLSSMLVCRAFDAINPQNILDACAAPGGKSVYLSKLYKDAQIIACDIHEHRVKLIEKYKNRLKCPNINTMLCDAAKNKSAFNEKFDCVLCDVLCSGLGIVDSKPDILINRCEDDIKKLSTIQKNILQNVSNYVKKGGILIYSTCTILPEENQLVVNEFLNSNKNFISVKIKPLVNKGTPINDFIQFYPFKDNTEGFFIAKLMRL